MKKTYRFEKCRDTFGSERQVSKMVDSSEPKNTEPPKSDLGYRHSVGLTDEELVHIGSIVAQWAALEHEIFHQTLATFADGNNLPKEMSNFNFARVVELWEGRVLANADKKKREVLTQVIHLVKQLLDYRNALVHGMWEWDVNEPKSISSIRVRQKAILTYQFTADDLRDFSNKLGEINFKIRFPGGIDDYAKQIEKTGGHTGRFGIMANSSAKAAQ